MALPSSEVSGINSVVVFFMLKKIICMCLYICIPTAYFISGFHAVNIIKVTSDDPILQPPVKFVNRL